MAPWFGRRQLQGAKRLPLDEEDGGRFGVQEGPEDHSDNAAAVLTPEAVASVGRRHRTKYSYPQVRDRFQTVMPAIFKRASREAGMDSRLKIAGMTNRGREAVDWPRSSGHSLAGSCTKGGAAAKAGPACPHAVFFAVQTAEPGERGTLRR